MTNDSPLFKLLAMAPAWPENLSHSLDFNSLALAAQTAEGWHIYIVFSYDTAEDGGLPGACSVILPEAEEEDVLTIIKSGLGLGGYQFHQPIELVDLTHLLGHGKNSFLVIGSDDDYSYLANIVSSNRRYGIRVVGNIIEVRGVNDRGEIRDRH